MNMMLRVAIGTIVVGLIFVIGNQIWPDLFWYEPAEAYWTTVGIHMAVGAVAGSVIGS